MCLSYPALSCRALLIKTEPLPEVSGPQGGIRPSGRALCCIEVMQQPHGFASRSIMPGTDSAGCKCKSIADGRNSHLQALSDAKGVCMLQILACMPHRL